MMILPQLLERVLYWSPEGLILVLIEYISLNGKDAASLSVTLTQLTAAEINESPNIRYTM